MKHEIGDLVMKRFTVRKTKIYVLGVINNHRQKFQNRFSAYPWGVYWIEQDSIINNTAASFYTAGEITRFKNILKEYLEK